MPLLRRVHAVARRLARSPMAAEDLVQETYLRAYRTFDNFEPGTNALAWLLTILHSIHFNQRRRSTLEPQARGEEELEAAAQRGVLGKDWEGDQLARATAGRWGAGERVGAALEALPESFRSAVVLIDLQDLSYDEAAQALDCPIGTIRSRVSRARRLLAESLSDYALASGVISRRAT